MAGRKLIVGLGNPGLEYFHTRHNVGFRVLDQLSTRFGVTFKLVKEHQAEECAVQIEQLLLAKPRTYMNLSGDAVQAICHYFKIEPESVLVVHDDVSLPLGRVRLQKGGGAGGQHGIESIIRCLGGDKSFHRLKVGVGPDPGGAVRAQYVLSGVRKEDADLYEKVLSVCGDAVISWKQKGIQETSNFYNGQVFGTPFGMEPPSPPPAAKPKTPKPVTENHSPDQGSIDPPGSI